MSVGAATVVVIGIGNPYRRDDGVGPLVVDRLRRCRPLPGVALAECDGELTRLLDLWEGADLAVVVDAIRTPSPRPGTIHHRVLRRPGQGGAGSASSHSLDLGDAVSLAAALDRLPGMLVLFAVEVADTSYGRGLTPPVEAAVDGLLDEIVAAVSPRR